jgi:hypothetical protein
MGISKGFGRERRQCLIVFLLILVTTLADAKAESTFPPRQLQSETSKYFSTEELFDLLDSTNKEEEEEQYPPLRTVDHYVLSWSVLMSLASKSASLATSPLSFSSMFASEEESFKLELRLSCPEASRLVLGLIDISGRRISLPTAFEDTRSGSIACGPPIGIMSRNVLECRGIPESPALNKDTLQQQILFENSLELTCLGYADEGDLKLSGEMSESQNYRLWDGNTMEGRASNTRNQIRDDNLRLVIQTPAQTIKTVSDALLTETLYAAKITNSTLYTNSKHKQQSVQSEASPLDSSMFTCSSRASEKSTKEEPRSSESCQDKVAEHSNRGLCSRSMSCYYSADSLHGTCKASMTELVLSSTAAKSTDNPDNHTESDITEA